MASFAKFLQKMLPLLVFQGYTQYQTIQECLAADGLAKCACMMFQWRLGYYHHGLDFKILGVDGFYANQTLIYNKQNCICLIFLVKCP